jgi:hypothetical protein
MVHPRKVAPGASYGVGFLPEGVLTDVFADFLRDLRSTGTPSRYSTSSAIDQVDPSAISCQPLYDCTETFCLAKCSRNSDSECIVSPRERHSICRTNDSRFFYGLPIS